MEFSEMMCSRRRGVDLLPFTETWNRIQESTRLTVAKPLNPIDWQYLMDFLVHADLSQIEHLELVLPHWDHLDRSDALLMNSFKKLSDLGSIVGQFSALRTLRIDSRLPNEKGLALSLKKGEPSLLEALKVGKFTNLRTLSLPTCDVAEVLKTLTQGRISQLSSLSITRIRQWDADKDTGCVYLASEGQQVSKELDAVLKKGFFKSLQYLDLTNRVLDGIHCCTVFSGAIKSGLLPGIKSLHLRDIQLPLVNLADLVPLLCFNSLENLTMDRCGISSEQFCSMVSEILKVDRKHLALKRLSLQGNLLGNSAVDALIKLIESESLPQLQELDLSVNRKTDSRALVSLTEIIQRGYLPKLLSLNWEKNPDGDVAAQAIVTAYLENEALTAKFDIDWIQVSDPSLRTKVKECRDRNLRLLAAKEKLKESIVDVVPLTSAKVFLCGYPEVGKTTLRKTLPRKLGKSTKLKWERRPTFFKEPRTRGIELTRIEEQRNDGQNITLVLWDLAGQDEFHVLHGSFLADLDFAGGKATTFVLVFRAPFETDVTEEKLLHWLRFVASSSIKDVRRHVVIVLNCFAGEVCKESHKKLWVNSIARSEKRFHDLLHIHLDPFIIDVRVASSVKSLKDHLFERARMLLRDIWVPRVCFELKEKLKVWSKRDNKSHLPIFSWQAFENGLNLGDKENYLGGEDLRATASYLHEMGEIIYFDGKEPTKPGSEGRSVVVADPEWFCKQVVGELLLPPDMREGDNSMIVKADGSILIYHFEAFFENLLVEGTRSEDVISMLERLGLCYRKGGEEIIVPALIRRDDYSLIHWEGKGLHGVMGRSLVTKDKERTAIPGTLFRKLQVALAQDRKFGGRADSGYRAGKSFSSFTTGGLLILIQFDVDHSDPTDDRIDILIKSELPGDPTDVSLVQVNCICEIEQQLKVLCFECCPGLIYDIKVIKPWSATSKTPEMTARELISLNHIKDLLIQGERHTSWQLNGHQVELKTFVSNSELNEILEMKTLNAEREYSESKQVAMTLGLLSEDSLKEIEASEEECNSNLLLFDMQSNAITTNGDDHGALTKKFFFDGIEKLEAVVRGEGNLTRQYIDTSNEKILLDIQQKHGLLVQHIQLEQSFSIEEKESSVPRFMFLSRKQGKYRVWISLTEAFQSTFRLHLLCEARFGDGFLHEVEGQEGIELNKNNLEKISPWFRRSLQVALMVAQTVGDIYLPGIAHLIPHYQSKDRQALAKAVDNAATMLLKEGLKTSTARDVHRGYGSATHPIDVKERLVAQEVIHDLRAHYGHGVFAKKVGLRKVLLRTTSQAHVGTSKQAQPSVVWVCEDCYRKYGDRATDIRT